MLFELLKYLLTPHPRWLRELGYPRELRGIRRRYRQWRWAWHPHCEHSRRLILSASQRCRQRRKAVVLGSGYLHDVPLDELSQGFQEVVLVDILHPLAARWHTRRYRNVKLLTADVSGTAEAVWRAVEQRTPLPRATPHLFVGDEQVDLLVSLNLLSQLPCMPEQYLRQTHTHTPAEIDDYCRHVVQAHLDYLTRLPGVAALIADVEARTMSTTGTEVARRGTLYGVDFPFAGEQWIWALVPRKRNYPHHAEHLVVTGIEDIKNAERR